MASNVRVSIRQIARTHDKQSLNIVSLILVTIQNVVLKIPKYGLVHSNMIYHYITMFVIGNLTL